MELSDVIDALATNAACTDPSDFTSILNQPTEWLDPMRATWVSKEHMDEAVQSALVAMSIRLREQYFAQDPRGEEEINQRLSAHLLGLGHRVGRRLLGTEHSPVQLPPGPWSQGTPDEIAQGVLERLQDIDATAVLVAVRPVYPFFSAIASQYTEQGALDGLQREQDPLQSSINLMLFGLNIAVLEAAISTGAVKP